MSVQIPCPYCEGTGCRALSGRLDETLTLLRTQPSESSGATLARLADIDETEANNRLHALEQMGLATGRWSGRERLWIANREAK